MNERYITRTRIRSEEEIRRIQKERVDCARNNLEIAVDELVSALCEPPASEYAFQEKVLPGHPDYDNASIVFEPHNYHGDMVWSESK
jgi:hypothetical protein